MCEADYREESNESESYDGSVSNTHDDTGRDNEEAVEEIGKEETNMVIWSRFLVFGVLLLATIMVSGLAFRHL